DRTVAGGRGRRSAAAAATAGVRRRRSRSQPHHRRTRAQAAPPCGGKIRRRRYLIVASTAGSCLRGRSRWQTSQRRGRGLLPLGQDGGVLCRLDGGDGELQTHAHPDEEQRRQDPTEQDRHDPEEDRAVAAAAVRAEGVTDAAHAETGDDREQPPQRGDHDRDDEQHLREREAHIAGEGEVEEGAEEAVVLRLLAPAGLRTPVATGTARATGSARAARSVATRSARTARTARTTGAS